MVKEKEIKKTYYTLDIKNPYCSKGEFAWKHNDDSTLGKEKFEKVNKEFKEIAGPEEKAWLKKARRAFKK